MYLLFLFHYSHTCTSFPCVEQVDELLRSRERGGGGGARGGGGGEGGDVLLSRPCMTEEEKSRLLQQYDCFEEAEWRYPHTLV